MIVPPDGVMVLKSKEGISKALHIQLITVQLASWYVIECFKS